MSRKSYVEWLNHLEKCLQNITSMNASFRCKLKNLNDQLQELNNDENDFTDFDTENIFYFSEENNLKEKNNILSCLENASMHSNDLLEESKLNLENTKKECSKMLTAANAEISAIKSISTFLNSWKEKTDSDCKLNDYPKKFIDCVNGIRNKNIRNVIIKDLSQIKTLNISDENDGVIEVSSDKVSINSERMQVLQEVNRDAHKRLANLSILDYTRCDEDLSSGPREDDSRCKNHSLLSFTMNIATGGSGDIVNGGTSEEEEDILNKAMVEDNEVEDKDGFLRSYIASEDYPEIDTCNRHPSLDEFSLYHSEVSEMPLSLMGSIRSNPKSKDEEEDEEYAQGSYVLGSTVSVLNMSQDSCDYSFNRSDNGNEDFKNRFCGHGGP